MKKSRLVNAIAFDFDLLGLVSSSKEYQLAWHLNKVADLHFIKNEDINIEFNDLQRIVISNYVSNTGHSHFTLLKNKLITSNSKNTQLLLPELQKFDYFLKFQSKSDDIDMNQLISSIRDIAIVDYLAVLDIDKIKQKENLLY